jgi:hypothetical protein
MPRITALCLLILLSIACFAVSVRAQETQIQYLSGHDKDDAIPWDFFGTAGRHANQWAKIPVPSNWELQGFGRFTYQTGPPVGEAEVQGRYKRTFSVPAGWSSKRVC